MSSYRNNNTPLKIVERKCNIHILTWTKDSDICCVELWDLNITGSATPYNKSLWRLLLINRICKTNELTLYKYNSLVKLSKYHLHRVHYNSFVLQTQYSHSKSMSRMLARLLPTFTVFLQCMQIVLFQDLSETRR